jgi:hypothetical protein
MTAYNPPTDAELGPEKPLTSGIAKRIRDVSIAISEGATGAPKIQNAAIDSLAVTTAKFDTGAVTQEKIGNSAVGQAQLKTATDSDGTVSTTGVGFTLQGGEYGFYPRIDIDATSGQVAYWGRNGAGDGNHAAAQNSTSVALPRITIRSSSSSVIASYRQRFVDACPPYDMGDGEIPLFSWLVMINGTGEAESGSSAQAAPWHMNGPTDIRAHYYDAQRRGWAIRDKKEMVLVPEDATDYVGAGRAAGWRRVRAGFSSVVSGSFYNEVTNETSLASTWKALCEEQHIKVVREFGDVVPSYVVTGKELVEITQEMKQRDMPLIPHPFQGNDLTGKTVVLLDPVSDLAWRLAEQHENGVSALKLVRDGYLQIDNEPLNRAGPPGVMVVRARWKNTSAVPAA